MAQGDWVAQHTTLVPWGITPQYLKIVGGRLTFNGSSIGTTEYEGALVKWRATMIQGGMRVTAQVRDPSGTPAFLIICASTDWSSFVAVAIRNVSVGVRTGAHWGPIMTQRTSVLADISDGDYVSVDWLSGQDRYDVYVHTGAEVAVGAEPALTWIDTGHIVPHGAAYQYAGVICCYAGQRSAAFEDFSFQDLAAAPDSVAGTGLSFKLPHPLPPPCAGTPVPLSGVVTLTAPIPGVQARVATVLPVLTLSAPIPSINKTHIVDTFSGTLASFTNQGPTNLTVSGGIATPASTSTWNFALCNTPFMTKAQYVECVIAGSVINDVLILVVMGSSTLQPFAYLCNNGGNSGIYTNPDGYNSIIGPNYNYTRRQSGSLTWANGDILRFEVSGVGASKVFTAKKNGTTLFSWADTGNIVPDTNTGGGFGYYLASAGARGVDQITVADT